MQVCPALQATQAPLPLQTMPVPQALPADLLPKSTQTGAPVWQLVMPVLQAVGLVEQFAFAVHAVHAPDPLQTMLVPQPVPPGLAASSTQVCAPVAQDVVPVLQAFELVVHACPGAHATQPPLPLQTIPTPQLVPAARFIPSAQVVALPLQVVVPCLQAVGLPVQLWPATQVPQNPLPSHIWPPVHIAVGGLAVPSMQTDVPVVQEVMPLRQIDGLAVQVCPAVQDAQVPIPLQTWLVPQFVPAAVFPASRQRGAPIAQSTTPVLHGALGLVVQAWPAMQATHCPLPLQTMPEPHAVPAPALSPSTHPGAIPHATTPILHRPPGLPVQTVPAAHVVHEPLLQTLSVPQEIPSAASAPSSH